MANFTGTVRKNDLEGGFLELVTDAGETYRLQCTPGQTKAGQRVKVSGKIDLGGFGIHMTGPVIEVDGITVIED